MITFLYTITVITSIFIGFILSKEYTLLKDYKKNEEDLAYLDSQIKELKNEITQSIQGNTITSQKHDPHPPNVILDNKIYSQQEFSKEINSGKFQMSSMLQSKLHEKDN